MNSRKLPKHEVLIIVLILASIFFAFCSFIPYGPEEGTGILQGISTSIFTGVILLLINGIKSTEYNSLIEKKSVFKEISEALTHLYHIYGLIYHKTYHGKKENMGIVAYHDLLEKAYDECKNDWATIDLYINDSSALEMIKDYDGQVNLSDCCRQVESQLNIIFELLDNVDFTTADMSDIDKIRETFCGFHNITEPCEEQMSALVRTIDAQLERVNHSLF